MRIAIDRLKAIQTEFADQGVQLIGMNANDAKDYPDESFEAMEEFAASVGLNFPYLRDVTQDVAQCFGVEATPEVFLLDQGGIIRYAGQIDDNPDDQNNVNTSYLRQAITQLLAGEPVTQTSTKVIGCTIKWRKSL